MTPKPNLRAKLRLGYYVFGALLVIEIVEYVLGTSLRSGAWPYLALLAVPGSALIVHYFMHITHLWHRGE